MAEKILVVCRNYWPEKNRINDLSLRLAQEGFKVDVLCGQPSDENGDFCKNYNSFRVRREIRRKINIYRTFDVKRGNSSNVRLFLNYTVFPVASLFQIKKICKNRYDAVLVYQVSPVFMCAPGIRVASALKIPVYIMPADLWPERLFSLLDVQSTLFKKILYHLSMHYYKKADKLLVTTEKMRSCFMERLGMTKERLPLVTVSPDPVFAARVRDESLMEKLAGSFNVVLIGDFEEQLSVSSVISLADMVRQNSLRNIRFLILGDSDLISSLRERASSENLLDYFFFEGKVSDRELGKYLFLADILAAIIKPEKTNEYMIPEQVIDYLSAGIPLLLTLSGNVRDLVKKAECGFTSEPEDVKALFSNLLRLYRMNAGSRKELGKNARKYQQEHFSLKENARRIAAVLEGKEPDADMEPSDSGIRKLW